ncbi:type I-E CRISPR-associated protein Cse2/CasB [Pararhodobacter sp. SW119]|uniref:type I-E CRISPR-associated protein Cse2/CasB n=1 Tax=Pararhodobacter sp. SW119 TaxID=2780075 RepID=UPI001AE023FE|nr:type I-E CRISPR-associated protein Cse2/CasB [Pararhodobacter sp. SW119]
MNERMGRGETAAEWWRRVLADRDSGAARGLAARLKRATPLEALAEPAVHELARLLGLGAAQASVLVRLVQVLAEIRENDPASLARRLGGPEPVMSNLRFQRLLRAEGEDVATALRRSVIMADRRCNIARLARDLLVWDHPDWGEETRAVWCFHYFGAPTPGAETQPSEETAR